MKIEENVSLAKLTTMQIGGFAKFVLTCETREDIRDAVKLAKDKNLPWFVLGGGSNVISSGDFNGAVILNRIKGFREVNDVAFQIGAGEITDDIIAKLCAKSLSGVECLSLIPGRIGGLPVQNVGAYGQEISQTLTELTVFDIRDNSFKTLTNTECQFAYRDSIFKSQTGRHYIICDITLQLSQTFLTLPLYPALENYFREHQITDFSPMTIREAVIAIRNSKLPPVATIPSAGSFFKNPIVDEKVAKKLLEKFPSAPHWPMENSREKLAAGWLVDQAGLKSFAKYGFQIYPQNALVITNIAKDNSAENLAKFKSEIVAKVREKFSVELEQEPESL